MGLRGTKAAHAADSAEQAPSVHLLILMICDKTAFFRTLKVSWMSPVMFCKLLKLLNAGSILAAREL